VRHIRRDQRQQVVALALIGSNANGARIAPRAVASIRSLMNPTVKPAWPGRLSSRALLDSIARDGNGSPVVLVASRGGATLTVHTVSHSSSAPPTDVAFLIVVYSAQPASVRW